MGDIASVSDVGLDKQNLFRKFCDEGSPAGHASAAWIPTISATTLAGEQVGEWPKLKMKLLLPTERGVLPSSSRAVPLSRSFRDVMQSSRPMAELKREEPGVRFSIRYDQSRNGHRAAATRATTWRGIVDRRNPIYRALRAKADQTQGRTHPRTPYASSSSATATAPPCGSRYSPATTSARQIATEFLRK